jgi:phage shock protein PspC (stress-responsive transcriptional regulator)
MPISRLTRSRSNGTIAGVCAGLANYLGVDVVLVRLLFVVVALATAIIGGIVIYAAAWLMVPEGHDQPVPASDARVLRRSTTDAQIAGVCGGLAEYFQLDATLVRLIWVIASIFCGAIIGGIIIYALAWLIIPRSMGSSVSTPVQASMA